MAYQDIWAPQTADLAHEATLKDLPAGETRPISKLGAGRSGEWVRYVLALLDNAVGQLQPSDEKAHGKILQATSLLRKQIDPQIPPDGNGRLLAWQARKVRDYIASHLPGPIRVADLCALIRRSEAHFSRSFKHTFGESPHAYVIRCRVQRAAHYMLQTDAPLRDIALRCGFTDQAHLCKHFRQVMGETPAAWRRVRKTPEEGSTPHINGSRERAPHRLV
jgi:AraC family transcriptional regulator